MSQFETFLVLSAGNTLPHHNLSLYAAGYGEGNFRSKMLSSDDHEDANETEMGKATTLTFANIYFASGSEFHIILREENVHFGK